MAAYKYGSVVIFNGRDREKEVLKLCQEFCTEPTKQHYTEGDHSRPLCISQTHTCMAAPASATVSAGPAVPMLKP